MLVLNHVNPYKWQKAISLTHKMYKLTSLCSHLPLCTGQLACERGIYGLFIMPKIYVLHRIANKSYMQIGETWHRCVKDAKLPN